MPDTRQPHAPDEYAAATRRTERRGPEPHHSGPPHSLPWNTDDLTEEAATARSRCSGIREPHRTVVGRAPPPRARQVRLEGAGTTRSCHSREPRSNPRRRSMATGSRPRAKGQPTKPRSGPSGPAWLPPDLRPPQHPSCRRLPARPAARWSSPPPPSTRQRHAPARRLAGSTQMHPAAGGSPSPERATPGRRRDMACRRRLRAGFARRSSPATAGEGWEGAVLAGVGFFRRPCRPGERATRGPDAGLSTCYR
jgi:hypothetical protein